MMTDDEDDLIEYMIFDHAMDEGDKRAGKPLSILVDIVLGLLAMAAVCHFLIK